MSQKTGLALKKGTKSSSVNTLNQTKIEVTIKIVYLAGSKKNEL